jgi:streptogramin lyase
VANAHARRVLAFDARTQRLLASIPEPNRPAAVAADRGGGVWVAVRDRSGQTPDIAIHYDATGRLLRQVPFARGIAAILVRPRSLWVAELREPQIDRVDLRTGGVRVFAQVIRPARAMAWGAGHLWATSPDDDALVRIDPKTHAVATQNVGHFPVELAVTGGRVFVASVNDQALIVVDPRTMRPVQRLPMPLNPYAVTADARHVWVTSLGENAIARVDLS